MAKLLFKDVNKVYPNGYHAVHDFNMEIGDGEFICLVGDSGCGKSTTLRMIAGLEDITSGEFYIDGKLANQMSSRDRGIAMVFQSYALYPHLTVYENLAFGLTLEGIDADVIEEKVQATAKILGLTDYLERFPRALSGGQCQRVAVGRALIRKVNMKSGGYVQQIGTPFELYFYPKNLFVAGFIGEPPMNFIRGTVENGRLKASRLEIDLAPIVKDVTALEGKKAVFAFRPEAIKLNSTEKCYKLSSKVELTELLGDTTNVYATIGEEEDRVNIILKVNPHHTPEMGAKFDFVVPYTSSYVFDAETGLVVETDIVRH